MIKNTGFYPGQNYILCLAKKKNTPEGVFMCLHIGDCFTLKLACFGGICPFLARVRNREFHAEENVFTSFVIGNAVRITYLDIVAIDLCRTNVRDEQRVVSLVPAKNTSNSKWDRVGRGVAYCKVEILGNNEFC